MSSSQENQNETKSQDEVKEVDTPLQQSEGSTHSLTCDEPKSSETEPKSEPKLSEAEPQSSEAEPQSSDTEPKSSEAEPKSEPKSSEAEPKSEPKLSEAEPQSSEAEPQSSDTEPKSSEAEPKSEPKSSEAEPKSEPKSSEEPTVSETEPKSSETEPKSRPKASDCTEEPGTSTPTFLTGDVCSMATVENARYSVDGPPLADHPNEDRHFALKGDKFITWCVFDGHNGSRAAEFAYNYLLKRLCQPSWMSTVKQADIGEALKDMFMDTEKEFFDKMKDHIERKKELQSKIPPNLTSYAAYMQFPAEVQELQEIEPELSGGCTAAMAVVIDNVLYVANVGDSRVLLVLENSEGKLVTQQLSVDHTVENEDELNRLEAIGLSSKDLIKAGRLGTQENTRSIGDYSIKEGYKDVDSLLSAQSPPGIATPDIMAPRRQDNSWKYLILMTDGVYKTIESACGTSESLNDMVLEMIQRQLSDGMTDLGHLSESVLKKIKEENEKTFMENAKEDIKSPLAVACRKRDDMTLIVHKLF